MRRAMISRLRGVAAVVAFGVLVALVSAACSGRGAAPGGEVSITSGSIASLDGRLVTGSVRAQPGQLLEVSSGSARLALAGGGAVDVRAGRDGAALVVAREGADVRVGSALVRPGSGADGAATVLVGQIDVRAAGGPVRVDRGTTVRIAAYPGAQARVTWPGGGAQLSPLRELVASRGVQPTSSRPLTISSADDWDRQYMADPLQIDAGVDALVAGLRPQLRAAGISGNAVLRYITPLVPGPSAGRLPGDDAEKLAAAVIASGPGEPTDRVARIVNLRAAGASWGVSAADFGLRERDVVPPLRRLIDTLALRSTAPVSAPAVSIAPGSTAAPRSPGSTAVPVSTSTPSGPAGGGGPGATVGPVPTAPPPLPPASGSSPSSSPSSATAPDSSTIPPTNPGTDPPPPPPPTGTTPPGTTSPPPPTTTTPPPTTTTTTQPSPTTTTLPVLGPALTTVSTLVSTLTSLPG